MGKASYVVSRIRVLADRYDTHKGEGTVYSGREPGARHYFADGFIFGDQAALAHMIELCLEAGVAVIL